MVAKGDPSPGTSEPSSGTGVVEGAPAPGAVPVPPSPDAPDAAPVADPELPPPEFPPEDEPEVLPLGEPEEGVTGWRAGPSTGRLLPESATRASAVTQTDVWSLFEE